MSYEIVIEPEAQDHLNKKLSNSPQLLDRIEQQLEKLERSPTTESIKAPDNYPVKCQCFYVMAWDGFVQYLITFRFQYSQCETKLHVIGVDKHRMTP